MSAIITKNYDYIILGAGCAGLSLLMRMIHSARFTGKQILLIDKIQKTKNDRTWCFWEKKDGFFEKIVYKKWAALNFYSPRFSAELDIAPYQYKMIRGIDFYTYCFDEINKHGNIDVVYDEVNDISLQDNESTIALQGQRLKTGNAVIFNSIYNPSVKNDNSLHLLQHFKGWMIETSQPFFNPAIATLMDFRVHQEAGTTFTYTLPASETKALIEYTLFTKVLLNDQQYEDELKRYIHDFLKIEQYTILDKEFGVIPMTDKKFPFYENGMYHIGTAGGQTKASSGYTFQFIQKQSEDIVNSIIRGNSLKDIRVASKRFRFYDTVLLRLLTEKKLSGDKIFSRLFARNKASSVFKFLDNETSLGEELKLISTLPTWPFLKATMKK